MQTTDLTEKDALKVTWLGLLANLLLALAKGFIGFIANSSALIADAGVGGEMANAGAWGAALNVRINLKEIKDELFCKKHGN